MQRVCMPGAVMVKAAVLTVVEWLHADGFGRMYSGWPQGWAQVRPAPRSRMPRGGSGTHAHCSDCISMKCNDAKSPKRNTVRVSIVLTYQCGGAQWAYLLFTAIVLDYLHDAWFYWTHRFLHWRPIYSHIHYVHHQ